MNLRDHIKAIGGTATLNCPVLGQIATAANCGSGTLYMIMLGHKRPSAVLATRIANATSGNVTCGDLRPDVFGAPPAAPTSEAA